MKKQLEGCVMREHYLHFQKRSRHYFRTEKYSFFYNDYSPAHCLRQIEWDLCVWLPNSLRPYFWQIFHKFTPWRNYRAKMMIDWLQPLFQFQANATFQLLWTNQWFYFKISWFNKGCVFRLKFFFSRLKQIFKNSETPHHEIMKKMPKVYNHLTLSKYQDSEVFQNRIT